MVAENIYQKISWNCESQVPIHKCITFALVTFLKYSFFFRFFSFVLPALFKVQLIWEGQKNLHQPPYGFVIYFVNVKTIRRMAQIFVAFSEKLNFIITKQPKIVNWKGRTLVDSKVVCKHLTFDWGSSLKKDCI